MFCFLTACHYRGHKHQRRGRSQGHKTSQKPHSTRHTNSGSPDCKRSPTGSRLAACLSDTVLSSTWQGGSPPKSTFPILLGSVLRVPLTGQPVSSPWQPQGSARKSAQGGCGFKEQSWPMFAVLCPPMQCSGGPPGECQPLPHLFPSLRRPLRSCCAQWPGSLLGLSPRLRGSA